MAQPVQIRPARSFKEVGAFIDLPFRLHAGTPWIPPLKLERRMFLSRKPRIGTYAKRIDFELFCAFRAGEVVGRVSAHIDRAYNDHHGARWGWFGFFESIDDQDVSDALLNAAEGWLTDRGMERMVGPADFTVNDESGIVVDGHDIEPMIREPWHPRYYQRLMESAGMAKVVDLFMYKLDVSQRESVHPALVEVGEAALRDHGVSIRKMSRRRLRKDLDVFAEIYNRAWRKNWGFVPYSPEDLDTYALEMQLVYARQWFMVAEIDGEPVAIAITVPNVNQVLKTMNGRLLPFGWLKYLRRNRVIDGVRVGFLGVKPEFQHTGVAGALYLEHFDVCAKEPLVHYGETGWILETNDGMNRGMEAMNGTIIKRYRMYERLLDDDAELQQLVP
jgi:GNAT superfamily N-acetyltransferase